MKQKLVKFVLSKPIKQFEYFFNDYNDNVHADKVFIRKICTNLEVKIFSYDEIVISAGKLFDYLYLIDEGAVNIIDNTQKFVIATLPEGSFFGDYNILFNVKSNFDYSVVKKSEL